jgi:PEP-CTERM motif
MKKLPVRLLFLVLIYFLMRSQARSQGSVTFLSNLDQSSSGSVAVGSNSWIAATFFTGGNSGGYLLNSVQLAMNNSSGLPSGFTVMIYAEGPSLGGILPGNSVGSLLGSGNPMAAGDYSYSAPSGLTLAPVSAYFIVVTSITAAGTGAYEWSLSGTDSYNPTGGWGVISGVSSGVYSSINGTSWTSLSATYPQFAINATPAPEPGTLGLLTLGGMLIGLKRCNEKKRS